MVKSFRTDIQGLRAIAVALVVLYHCGVPWLSGGYVGVDVFFVISGFLITGHLIDGLDRTGRVDFGAFYARRVRRILPASFAVLVASLVIAWIVYPPLARGELLIGAAATALYVPNVLFAVQSTDYLAESAPSVFQHYWSLGVEEQFYLLWPLVLLAGFRLVRRTTARLFVVIAVLTVVSLIACIVLTPRAESLSFFLLPTRAWELGVGGLVAALLHRWNGVGPRGGAVLAWGGLAAVGFAALAFDATTLFPGAAALVPVIGTAAAILGGASAMRWSPAWLLNRAPMQFLGKISYSVYLVHWPLLVIPAQALGVELPPWALAAAAVLSVVLGALSHRFIEEPFRTSRRFAGVRPARVLGGAALASAIVLAVTGGAALASRPVGTNGITAAPPTLSAHAVVGTPVVPDNLVPSLEDAADDNPVIYASGCHLSAEDTDPAGCVVGSDRDAPRVVLFGDSHAAQWYPALAALADEGRIVLESHTKSSCPSADIVAAVDAPYPECGAWRSDVIERLDERPPALVVMSNYGSYYTADSARPARDWMAAYDRTLERLPEASRTIVLADTPRFSGTPAVCLSAHLADADACGRASSEALVPSLRAAEADLAGTTWVDLTDLVCSDSFCPVVLGDTLVYRDEHHMTATFGALLAPELGRVIDTELAR
ncbi:acyltransferase family protein [Agromyces sp. H3Y2-19a]|uniref:acyltransferase family protein n=1 Tax=Agromyces TaxID=33877 RepID=UPI0023B8AD29|nr:acyltransferase family protein [Agromyces chromiiresistens]MDF0514617.1 acyltransferase family protein [Agromyces chromiiresistens]